MELNYKDGAGGEDKEKSNCLSWNEKKEEDRTCRRKREEKDRTCRTKRARRICQEKRAGGRYQGKGWPVIDERLLHTIHPLPLTNPPSFSLSHLLPHCELVISKTCKTPTWPKESWRISALPRIFNFEVWVWVLTIAFDGKKFNADLVTKIFLASCWFILEKLWLESLMEISAGISFRALLQHAHLSSHLEMFERSRWFHLSRICNAPKCHSSWAYLGRQPGCMHLQPHQSPTGFQLHCLQFCNSPLT